MIVYRTTFSLFENDCVAMTNSPEIIITTDMIVKRNIESQKPIEFSFLEYVPKRVSICPVVMPSIVTQTIYQRMGKIKNTPQPRGRSAVVVRIYRARGENA